MRKYIALVVLTVMSSNAFALKYLCQTAVRGNSGKYNAISNAMQSYRHNGQFAANKQRLVGELDTAIAAIEAAGCPLNDPDVSNVLDPLRQLRVEVVATDAGESVAPANDMPTAAPTRATAAQSTPAEAQSKPAAARSTAPGAMANTVANTKLSYSCRQVLQRQSGKPDQMDNSLDFYRQAVAQGKTVAAVPGLEVEAKITAALSDLESGTCPLDHPDVDAVVSRLRGQLQEIPNLYAALKQKLDERAVAADPSSYPEFNADLAFFSYLDEKYTNIGAMYNANTRPDWRDMPGQSPEMAFAAIASNVKKPIFQFEALKDILANMRQDGERYNKDMPAFEQKYRDLLRFNQQLGQRYVLLRESAAGKMTKLYTEHYDWLSNNLPTAIETNLRVLSELAGKAVAEKKPHYFRGAVIPDASASNDQMIELYGLLSDSKKPQANTYKQQQATLLKKLRAAQDALADVMLNEMRLPPEKYNGADKEKIREAIAERAAENFDGNDLLRVIMRREDWNVTNYVSWSNSTAFHHHYSELGAVAVIREDDDVAKLVPVIYKVDHKQRDKVSIWFTETDEKSVYQNARILIKNM